MRKWLSFAAAFALLVLSGTVPSVAQDEADISPAFPGLTDVSLKNVGPARNFAVPPGSSTSVQYVFYFTRKREVGIIYPPRQIEFMMSFGASDTSYSSEGWKEHCESGRLKCVDGDRGEVRNYWVMNFHDSEYYYLTCEEALTLAKIGAQLNGHQVVGIGSWRCWPYDWAAGELKLAPKKATTAGQCTAKSYAGAWSRPGTGAQRAQVRLQFDDPTATKQPMGRVSGFNASPYGEGEVVVSQIQESKTCEFNAQCTSPLGSANPCTLNIDPAKGTLEILGGSKVFVSNVVWTRAAAAPQEQECGSADIEGNWTRTDGAQISVAGVRFKDGGNALLYNHPTGGWPQGAFKFSQIKSKGACDWEAQCATVYRDSAKGGFNTVNAACTLTVDPETKTMTASGTHGTFKR